MAATYLVKYTVTETDGREVVFVVGGRLDYRYEEKMAELAYHNIKIDGCLSVTDRLVKTDSEFSRSAWFPWMEDKYPTEEVIFGSLNTLRHWAVDLKLKTIYIHCDAGSHRSPTIMGMYLVAFKNHFDSFKMEPLLREPLEPGDKIYCSPALEYASTYLDEEFGKNYKELLPAIVDNFYGQNNFLEEIVNSLGWKNMGFPSKRQRELYD